MMSAGSLVCSEPCSKDHLRYASHRRQNTHSFQWIWHGREKKKRKKKTLVNSHIQPHNTVTVVFLRIWSVSLGLLIVCLLPSCTIPTQYLILWMQCHHCLWFAQPCVCLVKTKLICVPQKWWKRGKTAKEEDYPCLISKWFWPFRKCTFVVLC